jgi:hypothetical protein
MRLPEKICPEICPQKSNFIASGRSFYLFLEKMKRNEVVAL